MNASSLLFTEKKSYGFMRIYSVQQMRDEFFNRVLRYKPTVLTHHLFKLIGTFNFAA